MLMAQKRLPVVALARDQQHYRDRPLSSRRHAFASSNSQRLLVVTLSLLRVTNSGPNQLGLVAKNVKEYI
jgi:hypothetical protein